MEESHCVPIPCCDIQENQVHREYINCDFEIFPTKSTPFILISFMSGIFVTHPFGFWLHPQEAGRRAIHGRNTTFMYQHMAEGDQGTRQEGR